MGWRGHAVAARVGTITRSRCAFAGKYPTSARTRNSLIGGTSRFVRQTTLTRTKPAVSNHRVTSPPSPSIAGLSAGRLVSCHFASELEAALAKGYDAV